MSPRLEIDEYYLRGRWSHGCPRPAGRALAALVAGVLFAGFAVLIIGRDPNQGWNRLAQRWPAVVLAFAVGAAVETAGFLVLEARRLVITDEGVSVTRRRRCTRHPRATVRHLSIRCSPKRHILADAHWTALLQVHWADTDHPPLTIYGAARGIERCLPALAELYTFLERDVRPPGPGDPSETRHAEQELAELAAIRKPGRHRFCLRYGALPTAAVVLIGASLLLAFHLGWREALGFAAVFALLAMPLGYFFGLAAWWALAQRTRMLQQRQLQNRH